METQTGAEFISPAHVRHVMRYVKAIEHLNAGDSTLDAACGTGYGTELIRKKCPVIGLDFNTEALAEAKLQYPFNEYVHMDLLTASLQIRQIVSIETLEHFNKPDGRKLLGNFNSWLKPNGLLILSTPFCSRSGPSPITKQHLYEYSLTDLEMTLNDAGFDCQFLELQRHEGQAGRLGYCMVKGIKR